MTEFHEHFLAGDVPGQLSLLSAEAQFHSPAADYTRPEHIAKVLLALSQVVTSASATSVLRGDAETAVAFTARAEGRDLDGVLRVVDDGRGRVTDVTLLLRPLDALLLGIERMKALLR